MRIIHITPTLGCGGAEVMLGIIALEQVRRGDTVKIVILEDLHPTYNDFFLKDEIEKYIEIERMEVKISFSIFKNEIQIENSLHWKKILDEFKPDVVHSHLFKAEIVSRYTLYDTIRYVTHCHNNMEQFDFFQSKSLRRRISDYLESRWLLKKYKACDNRFIAISQNTENYFYKKLPASLRKNIFLSKNCINTSRYYSSTEKEIDFVRLITVGNLTENKGHAFLIEVVAELKKSGYNISLEVLGFGPLKNDLEDLIRVKGLEGIVSLKGNVSNVNEYLSRADIYVHAAYREGFGLVLLEAMASGLPVVTTDGGGNKDLLEDGHNGFLIKERSVKQFADKLIDLIENEELRKGLGGNAQQYSKVYDIIPYVDKLEKIYK